jgi:hypothetical protein
MFEFPVSLCVMWRGFETQENCSGAKASADELMKHQEVQSFIKLSGQISLKGDK